MYSKYFIFSLLLIVLASCGAKDGTNPNGGINTNLNVRYYLDSLEYEFYTKNMTMRPQINDYLNLHYAILNEKGDTIASTYRFGKPVDTKVVEARSKNDPLKILQHATAGDSLAIWVDAKANFALNGHPLPDSIPAGSKLKYLYWIFGVKPLGLKLQERKAEEDAILRKYFVDQKKDLNKIFHDPQSGLYWEELFDGGWVGERKPYVGDSVVINYKTYDLGNNLVDQSPQGKYVPLRIGGKRLLPAWEFALMNLLLVNKEVRLYIPSHLAFGDMPRPIRNANTNMEVELLPFTILVCELKLMGIVQ